MRGCRLNPNLALYLFNGSSLPFADAVFAARGRDYGSPELYNN